MSATTERSRPPAHRAGSYFAGIRDVVVLELKQRLRSRGWYIMLAIWFALTAVVTFLTWAGWNAGQSTWVRYEVPADAGLAVNSGPGSLIFEVVLAFVLLFALLVAPALSANAVNGDRAGGTLAILQVTLLTPGQILWGKILRRLDSSARVSGGERSVPHRGRRNGRDDAGARAGCFADAGG